MKRLKVEASKSYEVLIGANLLRDIGGHIKSVVRGKNIAVITDVNVGALYSELVNNSLVNSGYNVIFHVIKPGEESKSADTYIKTLDFLAEQQLSRDDTIIALGGGVVGDLAGFAAATYLRGIKFVQAATTLLAAVDSSVGGKTAINLKAGKNLAGAFYQPDLVLCDISTFSTLSKDIFRDGIAEIIKYAFVADNELFELLKFPIENNIEEIIYRCLSIKIRLIASDEYDRGQRQLLNFGHTVGHAIEKLSNYKITHGHAVALGMAVITKAAADLTECDDECFDEIMRLLHYHGFDLRIPFDADEIFEASKNDKKKSSEYITAIIPEEIGRCVRKQLTLDYFYEYVKLGIEGLNQD